MLREASGRTGFPVPAPRKLKPRPPPPPPRPPSGGGRSFINGGDTGAPGSDSNNIYVPNINKRNLPGVDSRDCSGSEGRFLSFLNCSSDSIDNNCILLDMAQDEEEIDEVSLKIILDEFEAEVVACCRRRVLETGVRWGGTDLRMFDYLQGMLVEDSERTDFSLHRAVFRAPLDEPTKSRVSRLVRYFEGNPAQNLPQLSRKPSTEDEDSQPKRADMKAWILREVLQNGINKQSDSKISGTLHDPRVNNRVEPSEASRPHPVDHPSLQVDCPEDPGEFGVQEEPPMTDTQWKIFKEVENVRKLESRKRVREKKVAPRRLPITTAQQRVFEEVEGLRRSQAEHPGTTSRILGENLRKDGGDPVPMSRAISNDLRGTRLLESRVVHRTESTAGVIRRTPEKQVTTIEWAQFTNRTDISVYGRCKNSVEVILPPPVGFRDCDGHHLPPPAIIVTSSSEENINCPRGQGANADLLRPQIITSMKSCARLAKAGAAVIAVV
ncbi:hypothetical protein AAG570_005888 [Ranatra chinensis]|uniref:Uncharacterized protein n=1 Tax=Ranatra chinensis TaxID=642074 RepID=A0ABD0XWR4_9HEMI